MERQKSARMSNSGSENKSLQPAKVTNTIRSDGTLSTTYLYSLALNDSGRVITDWSRSVIYHNSQMPLFPSKLFKKFHRCGKNQFECVMNKKHDNTLAPDAEVEDPAKKEKHQLQFCCVTILATYMTLSSLDTKPKSCLVALRSKKLKVKPPCNTQKHHEWGMEVNCKREIPNN